MDEADLLFEEARNWAVARGVDRTDFEGIYLLAAKKLAQDLVLAHMRLELSRRETQEARRG